VALTACTKGGTDGSPSGTDDATPSAAAPAPETGACRVLRPSDIAKKADSTAPVACSRSHTAETYLVDTFRGKLAKASYDDPALAAHAYQVCSKGFKKFTGADDSLALRSVLSWAWFRSSESDWTAGARWYRCDVVGGTDQSAQLVTLPRTAKGVLLGIPGDRWMACVDGPSVTAAPYVPCTQPHTWRAATTIVVGQPGDKYPGDRLVEVQTRDYCSDSVGAWMNYPIDYKYAYTWFHRAEWAAGNRRSICWAGTAK
jgi:hypothetical protein